jgi:hypothetical protein
MRITRLALLGLAMCSLIAPTASAQLNKDPSPPGDDGGLKCYECINDACAAAETGHAGKHKCTTTCDIIKCSCALSGAICTGGSARIWIVPNGEGLTPASQQPPTGSLEALLRGCA